MNIKLFLKRSWDEGTQIGIHNIWSTALIGSSAHFLFHFIFKYIFHIYDNFLLRMLAVLLCILVVPLYKKKVPWFYYYWHFLIIYALPFIFTVHLLKSNFNELWIYWEIFMIFILIMHVPNWFICLVDLFIGIIFAIIYYIISSPVFNLKPSFNITFYLIVIIFSVIAGILFNYANRVTSINKLRRQYLQLTSMAGSIVHEIRNPLNNINMINVQLKNFAKDVDDDIRKKINDVSNAISDCTKQANEIINIVLNDLNHKPIDQNDFSYISAVKIISEIIKKYGYSSDIEKQKVKLDINEKNDFIFRAIEDRFVFVIYNLLKNALYYLKEYPDSLVTIGIEKALIKDKEYNVIYVHDTGPGIAPDIISKLFNDFFTVGKKEGTGLGLAFCKRNMQIFGGDIIVESKQAENRKNGWTKFSLLFPVLGEDEIKKASIKARMRKIIVVDDQKVNLLITKARIEQNLSNIICDIATNGFEAINLVKTNQYSLILMDIQMPNMNGILTAKEIRKFNQDIPIIGLTSLDLNSFLKQIGGLLDGSDFNDCLNKSAPSNILYRSVAKWIIDVDDNFDYLGKIEEYSGLQGKKIILADDQEMNLMMTKRYLEKNGLIVTKAKDGKELLEIYKNSLDENGKSSFDMIMTDINMSSGNGDEITRKIRIIESENNLKYKNIIPIIALSGDGQKEDIYNFFACGMTDYFVKGNNPELLIKIAINYLAWKSRKILESYKENLNQPIELKNSLFVDKNYKEINDNFTADEDFEIMNLNKINSFEKQDQKMVLEMFLKDSNTIIEQIKQNHDNIDKIHFQLHALKGIVGNIGAVRLFEYIKKIDINFKQNKPLENENWLKNLNKIYDDTVTKIKEILF